MESYLIWAVPLWICFKYRLLFFDTSPGTLGAVLALLWGAFVIWGAVIAPDLPGCEKVVWHDGAPLALTASALLPVLLSDAIRPTVGGACALIVAGAYGRHWGDGVCYSATTATGVSLSILTVSIELFKTVKI